MQRDLDKLEKKKYKSMEKRAKCSLKKEWLGKISKTSGMSLYQCQGTVFQGHRPVEVNSQWVSGVKWTLIERTRKNRGFFSSKGDKT